MGSRVRVPAEHTFLNLIVYIIINTSKAEGVDRGGWRIKLGTWHQMAQVGLVGVQARMGLQDTKFKSKMRPLRRGKTGPHKHPLLRFNMIT